MTDPIAQILIVDDRPEKVLALEAVLEGLGEGIVRAYSGREALRHVLNQEFAVILLDVNMPGMDGFETAAMIRQRKSSEHVPIIFVTAFGDEMNAARGYQLGAVDYILAPVMPEVLRTKVSVFVDVFRKTRLLTRQAEWQRRRANQLQKLAAASVAINAAQSIERMLQTITDTAREVVGSQQAITLFTCCEAPNVPARGGRRTMGVSSFSEKYAEWRDHELDLDAIADTAVARSRTPTRMSRAELLDHPDWVIVQRTDIPPVTGGMMAAPLTGRDGTNLGVVYLSDRIEGDFTNDDEAILVQLAQMASSAIENTIYAEEREANRLKDEFLATLSHELRTPLNAILGWTQLLRLEELAGDAAHGVEVIERNARAQAKLIEDLLDVSRITTGKLRLSTRDLPVRPIIDAAIDAVRPAAETKEIQIATELGAPSPLVHVDPDRLQQVVWNLLSNAVKFTDRGGRISITLSTDGGRARLAVKDSGNGIDPKFLPYVFDRFRQADSTSTRAHGGLGIGLTIVRHILELHGGSVSAHSDGLGRGSTFTVELPTVIAQPAETLPPQPAVAEGSVEALPPTLRGVRVLLVDDEPDAREVLAHLLKRADAEVTAAASAGEALGLLQKLQPDVIVSDIAMPERDGYDLIQDVRRLLREQGGEIPAIALTAYAREEDSARALACGFQMHLAKPVEPDELVAAVAQVATAQTSRWAAARGDARNGTASAARSAANIRR